MRWSAGRHADHPCAGQISPWPARKVTEVSMTDNMFFEGVPWRITGLTAISGRFGVEILPDLYGPVVLTSGLSRRSFWKTVFLSSAENRWF